MWRFRHALLSAGPNQDSGKGSDIGVRAILKGEAQVDQRPLAAPESRPDIPETLVQDAAGQASSLGSRSHGSFQVCWTWYGPAGACRDRSSPQNIGGRGAFPLIAAQSPHDGRPSVSPSHVTSNRDAKPTPEARRPGSWRPPVPPGTFHDASVPTVDPGARIAPLPMEPQWSRYAGRYALLDCGCSTSPT